MFSEKWKSYFTFAGTNVYLISFLSLLILAKKRNRLLNYTYLLYLLMTPLFICLSGMTYGHYGMILVPAVAYPLALIFNEIEAIKEEGISQLLFFVVGVWCLSTVILLDWLNIIASVPATYEERNESHAWGVVESVSSVIDSLIDANDTISVYGNCDAVYVRSKRLPATRYSYQYPIGTVMPDILDEYFEQLQEEQPHIIVVQSAFLDDSITNFLTNNEYELKWSQNEEALDGALIYYK